MRYMMIYRGKEPAVPAPPSPHELEAMGKLIGEMTKAGILISTGGLAHSGSGVRVRREKEKVTVTDGPFTESKELVAGYAIVEAKSNTEAVASAKRFLEVVGEGESAIRPLFEG